MYCHPIIRKKSSKCTTNINQAQFWQWLFFFSTESNICSYKHNISVLLVLIPGIFLFWAYFLHFLFIVLSSFLPSTLGLMIISWSHFSALSSFQLQSRVGLFKIKILILLLLRALLLLPPSLPEFLCLQSLCPLSHLPLVLCFLMLFVCCWLFSPTKLFLKTTKFLIQTLPISIKSCTDFDP